MGRFDVEDEGRGRRNGDEGRVNTGRRDVEWQAGAGGSKAPEPPDYTAQPRPNQQISEEAGKGQTMHKVEIRDAGGWVGREEEAEEGVVEVKGKAGSPGRDGDGGGGFDSQM
ncbi:uncharacterized protein N7473_004087 [Penicillium subrubescens]|uniref:uncharacterized protein n=1 Tax=Penicillium subrubescens TaxID=1316194 RepID=UPI002544D9E2|nr:uncharacterized protein N7473_004087 [Penicillium subrubescens]KAJ5907171.1 hypothetical protein N7473_004087 [Penicillium subrubescens]